MIEDTRESYAIGGRCYTFCVIPSRLPATRACAREGLGPLSSAAVLLLLALPRIARADVTCNPTDCNASGVVNRYYPAPLSSTQVTAAAGARKIRIDTAAAQGAAGAIAAGDLLLVIQMQDAAHDITDTRTYGDGVGGAGAGPPEGSPGGYTGTPSAGLYEYVVAEAAVGTAVATIAACTGGNAPAADEVCISGNGAGTGLLNTYASRTATTAQDRQTYQVVEVLQCYTLTLTGNVTAFAWNGRAGGVIALEALTNLDFAGFQINANAAGFRGGDGRQMRWNSSAGPGPYRQNDTLPRDPGVGNNSTKEAGKGEGIAGTPALTGAATTAGAGTATGSYYRGSGALANRSDARGAPGNAGGGGTRDTAGGGGGNGGRGGTGGDGWYYDTIGVTAAANHSLFDGGTANFMGGHGGGAYAFSTVTRAIMGGGGGGGWTHSGVNGAPNADSSWGGFGGGIVIVRAGGVTNPTNAIDVTADGSAGLASPGGGGSIGMSAGGGGAGGTIVFVSTAPLPALVLNARGGAGGSSGGYHSGGGGGGGGFIFESDANPVESVTAGAAGSSAGENPAADGNCPEAAAPFFCGASPGIVGVIAAATYDTTPGVRSCAQVTRASIRGVRVDPSGTVEFVVGSQERTASFDIYEPSEREPVLSVSRKATGLVKITDTPIMAPTQNSVTPIVYRASTRPISAGEIYIEETEVSGTRRMMGPFSIDDARLARQFERMEARVDAQPTERRGAAILAAPRSHGRGHRARGADGGSNRQASPDALRIETLGDGRATLTRETLLAEGVPSSALTRPGRLSLTDRGVPVPFVLTPDRSLNFMAHSLVTDHTDRAAYVLSWTGPPPAPVVPLTKRGFARRAGFHRVEQDLAYLPQIMEGADPWLWQFADVSGVATSAFELPPFRSAAEVAVRVGLVTWASGPSTVSVAVNGQLIGRAEASGTEMVEIEGTLDAVYLHPGSNEIAVTFASADVAGYALLDIADFGLTPDFSSRTVEVADISRFDSDLPRAREVDYLIVTHELFTAAAERIGAAKTAEGHTVAIVDAERAYDRFSGGVPEAAAIRALIAHYARGGRLKYVLLIGDDTFDPNNNFGGTQVSYLPSLMAWDPNSGYVPSENEYADVDGDGSPDLAIGRLPVETPAEALRVAAKIETETARLASSSGHVLVADNYRLQDPNFDRRIDEIAAGLSGPTTLIRLSEGAAAAREALGAGLLAGPKTVHYVGHGGPDIWADEGVLTSDDLDDLALDETRGSVMFAWSCRSNMYQYYYGPSIHEAALRNPGGAVAAIGGANMSQPDEQTVFSDRLSLEIARGRSLGEAMKRAKAWALKTNPKGMKPIVDNFSLFGDPALVLPR